MYHYRKAIPGVRNEQQQFGDKDGEIFVLTRKRKLHFDADSLQP